MCWWCASLRQSAFEPSSGGTTVPRWISASFHARLKESGFSFAKTTVRNQTRMHTMPRQRFISWIKAAGSCLGRNFSLLMSAAAILALATACGHNGAGPARSEAAKPGPTAAPAGGPATTETAAKGGMSGMSGMSGMHHGDMAGYRSLDVYSSGDTVDLLLGEYTSGNPVPALKHLRSRDGGQHWSDPVIVDQGTSPPANPHRGVDAQIAASGNNLVAVWTET